jgi:hypothetical protein
MFLLSGSLLLAVVLSIFVTVNFEKVFFFFVFECLLFAPKAEPSEYYKAGRQAGMRES